MLWYVLFLALLRPIYNKFDGPCLNLKKKFNGFKLIILTQAPVKETGHLVSSIAPCSSNN